MKANLVHDGVASNNKSCGSQREIDHAIRQGGMEISGIWLDISCKFPDGSVRNPYLIAASDAESGQVLAQTISTAPGCLQDQFELIGDALHYASRRGVCLNKLITDRVSEYSSRQIREFCQYAGITLVLSPGREAFKIERYFAWMSGGLRQTLCGEVIDLWRLADVLETFLYVFDDPPHTLSDAE